MKPIFVFFSLMLCASACKPTKTTQTKTVTKTVYDTVYVTDTVKITITDSVYYRKYVHLKEMLSVTRDSIKEITRPDGSTERTTYGEKQTRESDAQNSELLNRILSLNFSQKTDSSSVYREDAETDESLSRVRNPATFWKTATLLQLAFILLFFGYKKYIK